MSYSAAHSSQEEQPNFTSPPRRPATVVLAVVLMAPVFVAWLVGGFVWLVVTARTEGDTGMIFLWILAIAILALCLLLAFMCGIGMIQAWRGQSQKIRIPAYFTFALFFIALLNLIIKGKISFTPSQLVPLILGAFAGIALFLLSRKSAAAWFARSGGRR